MIDLVIPLKSGTPYHQKELLYSLRSIEKNLLNIRDVYIVADHLPRWIKNVKHIYGKDYGGMRNKEFNIATKICSACINENVSNPFLFSNDDIYILQEYDASKFPYYYYERLEQKLPQRLETDIYYKSMYNTQQALLKAHRDTKYFDVHCPILYDKEQFLRIVKNHSWKDCGFVIKSLYANLMCIEGEPHKDLKIKPPFDESLLKNRKWFSNSNLALRSGLFEYLDKLFPSKSKYEI